MGREQQTKNERGDHQRRAREVTVTEIFDEITMISQHSWLQH